MLGVARPLPIACSTRCCLSPRVRSLSAGLSLFSRTRAYARACRPSRCRCPRPKRQGWPSKLFEMIFVGIVDRHAPERVNEVAEAREVDQHDVVDRDARECAHGADRQCGPAERVGRVDAVVAVPRDRHAQVARDRELGDAVGTRIDAHEQDRVRAARAAVRPAVRPEHERRGGIGEQRSARSEGRSRARIDAVVGVAQRAPELPVAVADPEREHEQDAEQRQHDHAPRAQPSSWTRRRTAPGGRCRRAPRRLVLRQDDDAGTAARRRRASRRWRSGRFARGRIRPRRRLRRYHRGGGRISRCIRSSALLDGIGGVRAPPAIDPERRLGIVPGHGVTLPAGESSLPVSVLPGLIQATVGPCSRSSRRRSATFATSRCARSTRSAAADVIACEDTRRTRALLSALEIPAPELVACDERREASVAERLLKRALAGEQVALVSDSGMPLVADPGRVIVSRALAAGCPVVVLPGPSAVETALVASGLAAEGYAFLGWVPRAAGERRRFLTAALAQALPSVLFESPRRLTGTLAELARLAPEHPVAVARELTKLHEEVVHGSACRARGAWSGGARGDLPGAGRRAARRARSTVAGGARGGAGARWARASRPAARASSSRASQARRGERSTTPPPLRRDLHCPDAAPR